MDETAEFDDAIAAALEMTSELDTLILVTSDHSHAMITSGYAKRGNNIFEIAGKGSDGIVYSTLSYASGKYGFKGDNGERYDISDDDTKNVEYRFPAFVPMSSAAHAGEDVGIFCLGPWAHFCSGVVEQNYIPHLFAYAACVGSGLKSCDPRYETNSFERFSTSSSEISLNYYNHNKHHSRRINHHSNNYNYRKH